VKRPASLAAWLLTAGLFCGEGAGVLAASGDAAPAGGGLPLPAPGSYKLNRIQPAPQGVVLEGDRWPHWLSAYTRGKITLLSFFYTSCADRLGCPLAWQTFEEVREAVKQRADLQGRVRLVFISVDPARDTPDMLRIVCEYRHEVPPREHR